MKPKTVHRCEACGAEAPRWLGRCPGCGEWGSLIVTSAVLATRGAPLESPVPIGEVATSASERRATGIGELDRVLGGGLVPGSVTLLGGEPGMGKSTLLLGFTHVVGPPSVPAVPGLVTRPVETLGDALHAVFSGAVPARRRAGPGARRPLASGLTRRYRGAASPPLHSASAATA